ncbi:hypothetical protein TNCV_3897581 [Trichonephila clavipes]|nr:hypothetical protein TNCV_3897581 [Trichonephila clavipes]
MSPGVDDLVVRLQEEAKEPNSNSARKWEKKPPAEGRRRWKFWSETSATRNINQKRSLNSGSWSNSAGVDKSIGSEISRALLKPVPARLKVELTFYGP